jgi:predicted alpha/beta-hydrolase family hydrolase
MIRRYPATADTAPMLVLAHGAGAGHDHPWMVRVAQGLAARGIDVVTFNFPYKEARRSAPDRAPVLEARFSEVWHEAADGARGSMFAGGKSMGGRIASQVAAEGAFSPPAAGLLFLGYPLHPPGKPDQRRDRHLPNVKAPMLFISGTRDPFGSPEELQSLTSVLERTSLHLVDGGDHSLATSKKADRDGTSFDRVLDVAATWITGVSSLAST